ncbi:hypothetical protein BS78_04G233300, partial [Paspalum vaginatum]
RVGRDGGQVHGRKQRERSSAHCIHHSTVSFDLPGTPQNPMPLLSLSVAVRTHWALALLSSRETACTALLFHHLPMFLRACLWLLKFGKVKYAVQTSSGEIS